MCGAERQAPIFDFRLFVCPPRFFFLNSLWEVVLSNLIFCVRFSDFSGFPVHVLASSEVIHERPCSRVSLEHALLPTEREGVAF